MMLLTSNWDPKMSFSVTTDDVTRGKLVLLCSIWPSSHPASQYCSSRWALLARLVLYQKYALLLI